MPWSARIPTGTGYVELRYWATVTAEDIQAAFDAAMRLVGALPRPLLLADCSGMTVQPPLSSLYFLADQFSTVSLPHRPREALLMPALSETAESVTFWETTCANRGLDVRVFHAREPALDWLTTPDAQLP